MISTPQHHYQDIFRHDGIMHIILYNQLQMHIFSFQMLDQPILTFGNIEKSHFINL